MRIRTAGVIAVAALALAATGCGSGKGTASSSSTAKASGTLVIWADDQRAAALKPFADSFGKENGVTVTVQAVSKDLETNFVTASGSGKGPDIVVGAHDWVGNLVQNGTIDPVQLSDTQKSRYADIAIKAVTFNSQLYAIPYAIENIGLIRNTALAPNAPSTMDDVISSGQALRTSGKVSNILSVQVGQTGDAYHIYPLFASAGGYLFGTKSNGDYDPTDLGVGKPQSVAAFQKLAALGEKGTGALTRSITSDNAISTFTSGKTAYLISGPWAVADIQKAGIKYDITPVPALAGGKPATPFVGVQAFFVASKGKNKALAQEFVTNYVSKPDLQIALYKANPRPPALTSALTQVEATDPDTAKWLAAGKDGVVMPNIPAMAAVWDPFGKAEAAVIGGADVNTTVTGAAKTISDAIAKS
jgi:arabinogalactan oligomer/maltooligosaccharide transport system substrate-binding protein